MEIQYRCNYKTAHEQKFLDGLGFHDLRYMPKKKRPPRYELLKRYLKAMDLRENWGDIDPDVIRDRLIREIGEI